MTVNISESKAEEILTQPKVDTKMEQSVPETKLDTNVQAKIEEKAEDPNWRAFREARKEDRIKREQAEKRAEEKEAEAAALKAAMEAAFNRQNPQVQNQYEDEENEEQKIDRKVNEALAKRDAEFQRQQTEREIQEYPQRLRQTYSDFNQVISTENLDYLEYHYPEVAGPLQRLPNDYNKWSDIYRAVKKFVPNIASSKKDSARADSNINKPKSISSTGLSQPNNGMAQSAHLSEDKKQANWERMQRMLKGIS